MTDGIIELKNMGLELGGEQQLLNVNLSVRKGEALVLIGPSGQGKSVLLKTMAGILAPTYGQVFIEGADLNKITPEQKEKLMRKIGMLFQKNALFDSMTVADNIAFPLRETSSRSESDIQSRVDEYLAAVGLAHAKNLYPDEISGGMQKRLGIARALALDPEIIFYDDPTAGLDPITSRRIIELILQLKEKRGSTVVAISNDMARAYQMADQICMVVDQTVVSTGTVEQTKQHTDARVHQFIRGELHGPLTSGSP